MLAFPRLLALDAVRSPDEDRWMANTAGFTRKLAHGQLGSLVQQPHPGITTQWLGALTIRADDWRMRKLPIVVGNILLILAAGYLFARLWGKTAGLLTTAILGLDPFLYAHTRVYAMDSLLALFSVLSLGLLLLWRKEGATRYLIAAGMTAAAAGLSKLPGFILVPFSLLLLLMWPQATLRVARREGIQPERNSMEPQPTDWGRRKWKENWGGQAVTGLVAYLSAFLLGLVLILPSFAFAPRGVLGEFTELFRSDEYQKKHQLSAAYYGRTLVFFSAPVHLAALAAFVYLGRQTLRRRRFPARTHNFAILYQHNLISSAYSRRAGGAARGTPTRARRLGEHPVGVRGNRTRAEEIIMNEGGWVLILFAALFLTQMTLGAKKGDRYILPSLAAADAAAALVIITAGRAAPRRAQRPAAALVIALLVWQTAIIWQQHPHNLAYVNPLTRPWFGERRHGWGEGLSLAAEYLNQQPDAAHLKAASYYPIEFSAFFVGETVPIHQHDAASVDYVVLYRAMFERGQEAWETDIVNYYRKLTPEKIIRLAGLDFIWIYRRP